MNKKINLNLIQLMLLILIPTLIMSLIAGSLVYSNLNNNGNVTHTNNKYVNDFIDTYNKLLSDYYEDLDEDKLIDAAINGMLSYTSDDYTLYMDQDATDSLNDKLGGTYKGIGIRISINDENRIYVYEVFENSPAENAGILENDIIISINDEEVVGKTTDEVSLIIKNSDQDEIKIIVERNKEQLEFKIKKETLIVPALISSIKEVNNKKIGYIFIETFSSTIDTQVETTLISMEQNNIDSLIIDLRGNSGGYLNSCTNIIELFLKKNSLMYTIKSKDKTINYKDETDTFRDYPIVVLVDGGSASASEILAASLKYSYGAKIIGTKTYGKGKVQSTGELEDGTMYKYTSAKWYTPNGDCIDEIGIEPDINIELSDEFLENRTEEYDNQLNEALKILSS